MIPDVQQKLEKQGRQVEREAGRTDVPAVLGNGQGLVSLAGNSNFYYYRIVSTNVAGKTTYSPPSIALASGANIPEDDGAEVIISFWGNIPVVAGLDPVRYYEAGKNARGLNPQSPYNKFVLMQYAILAYAVPTGTQVTPTMEVYVKPFYYYDDVNVYQTAGDEKIDFTSYIPAAVDGNDMKVIAGLFLDRFGNFEVVTSTPKQIDDTLTHDVDQVEVNAGASARAMPIRSWVLTTGQTLLSIADEFSDTRAWLNTRFRLNNYSATAAPTVNDDIDLGYEVSSMWFDVTNDLAYVCLDSTDGAAIWREDISANIVNIAEADMLVWDAVNGYWENVPVQKDRKENIGFQVGARVKATASFNNDTRTFTLTHVSDYHVYDDSVFYNITGNLSHQISDDEGPHYIYFQNGALTSLFSPSDAEKLTLFSDLALAAIVNWNKQGQKISYRGEERHTVRLDGAAHKELHFTVGTWYFDDGGLALGNFDVDGSGNDDADAHFSVANGTIFDEDLEHNISNLNQTLSPIAELPIYYLDGTNWRRFWIDDAWAASTAYALGDRIRGDDSYFEVTVAGTSGGTEPTWAGNTEPGDTVIDNTVTWTCIGSPRGNVRNFVGGNYRVAYNQLVGAAWQQTEVGNGNFVLAHILATNNYLDNQLMVAIQGQETYTTITSARQGAKEAINNLFTGGLPFEEFIVVATVIYQTSNGYTNEVKARIRTTDDGGNYEDFRKTKLNSIGGIGITSFLGLTDTPSTYSGQALKILQVNSGETALEFVTSPSSAAAVELALGFSWMGL
jgi:hypothetical protein